MTLASKIATIAGLAGALALGGAAAQAQGYFGDGFHHHGGPRAAQVRAADRLNHQATVQADRGHFAKAAALHRRAAALRAAARHGY